MRAKSVFLDLKLEDASLILKNEDKRKIRTNTIGLLDQTLPEAISPQISSYIIFFFSLRPSEFIFLSFEMK